MLPLENKKTNICQIARGRVVDAPVPMKQVFRGNVRRAVNLVAQGICQDPGLGEQVVVNYDNGSFKMS